MIYLVVWLHFISDFIFQTDKMAKGKSSSTYWLGVHVMVYSLPFLILGWKYAVVNGLAHFFVDFVTSRASKVQWHKGNVHNFFVVIGLDQALHMTILIKTLPLANPIWN